MFWFWLLIGVTTCVVPAAVLLAAILKTGAITGFPPPIEAVQALVYDMRIGGVPVMTAATWVFVLIGLPAMAMALRENLRIDPRITPPVPGPTQQPGPEGQERFPD